MTTARQLVQVPLLLGAALFLATAPALAQQRTDVIQLVNGDKLTGEIKGLDRGSLKVRTDDLGTVEIKWDRVARVIASRRFEVETTLGFMHLGSLAAAGPGQVTVTEGESALTLVLPEIVRISPIGSTFWQQLEGHLDLGFNYTRSSETLQLNIDHATNWVRPSFTATLEAQSALTRTPEAGETGSSMLRLSYGRRRAARWLVSGSGQFDRNLSQGIELRAAGTVSVGRLLTTTNTIDSNASVGISVNEEYAVDAPQTTNTEALFGYLFSYLTHHFPKSGFDFDARLMPGLSQIGRVRFEIRTVVRRELFRDFTVALTFNNTYDNRPPGAETGDSLKNDFSVVTSIGWIF